jgi:hypothetical protein
MNFSEKIPIIPCLYKENNISSFRYFVLNFDQFRGLIFKVILNNNDTPIDLVTVNMSYNVYDSSENSDLSNIQYIARELNIEVDPVFIDDINNNIDYTDMIYYTELSISNDGNIIYSNLNSEHVSYSVEPRDSYNVLEFDTTNENIFIGNPITTDTDKKPILPSNYIIDENGLVKTTDRKKVYIEYFIHQ